MRFPEKIYVVKRDERLVVCQGDTDLQPGDIACQYIKNDDPFYASFRLEKKPVNDV